jgi:hypothetical protein
VRVARTLRLLVDEWGWPVVPGAFAQGERCSCGDPQCPEPGRHALADASWLAATSDPERVRDRWRAHPEAAVVVPVGWCFDLLEVPERGGREAIGRLEVMGHGLPPVIATAGGRLLFLVSALDRHSADVAEAVGAPAPRSPASPRPAESDGVPVAGAAGRDKAAARDAAAARAAVRQLEPWPASSTWLASAAGCRPETSIWVGGGAPDAPDVVVRRSGLLVVPLLGPEPPGVTRWLIPPSTACQPLPRTEDVLGPIVHACRDAAGRAAYGAPAYRPEGAVRRPLEPLRRMDGPPIRGSEPNPVRSPEPSPRRPDGSAWRPDAVADRDAPASASGLHRPEWGGPRPGPGGAPEAGPRRPEAGARRPETGRRLEAQPGGRPAQLRGPARPRPDRLARPVLGLVSGRGAGTEGPRGPESPGLPGASSRRGAPRVE